MIWSILFTPIFFWLGIKIIDLVNGNDKPESKQEKRLTIAFKVFLSCLTAASGLLLGLLVSIWLANFFVPRVWETTEEVALTELESQTFVVMYRGNSNNDSYSFYSYKIQGSKANGSPAGTTRILHTTQEVDITQENRKDGLFTVYMSRFDSTDPKIHWWATDIHNYKYQFRIPTGSWETRNFFQPNLP